VSQSLKEQFQLFRVRTFQDPKAFELLLADHATGLKRFLKVKLPSSHDADDAFSEVCMRTWDYACRGHIDHFSGFLFTVARNVIAEFYRTRANRPMEVAIATDEYEVPVESKFSGQKISEFVDGELMKEALAKLDDDDREVIIMRYLEGQTVKYIAEQMQKTENATSVLLHRALKKLRTIIESSAGGGSAAGGK